MFWWLRFAKAWDSPISVVLLESPAPVLVSLLGGYGGSIDSEGPSPQIIHPSTYVSTYLFMHIYIYVYVLIYVYEYK